VKLRNQRHLNKSAEEQRRIVEQSLASTRSSVLMKFAMKLEERLGERFDYPFGIRCVLTAIKR